MAKVELSPLRSWDDFLPGWERFGRPDTRDLTRWSNRVVSNLLYYQTNYLALAGAAFLTAGLVNPVEMFTALVVVSGVSLASLWAGQNRTAISTWQRQNPAAFVIAAVVAVYTLIFVLGSLLVFMLAVTLPLSLVFAHASFRLRNMKNKLENKIECAGLKRSPMGNILDFLFQQEQNFQKIQTFLDGKRQE
ncbi:ADP-ribosylation factor-like 6 interacting protein 5a [Cololabis saira]|uniref:ADP-ribosylation factor-like 6 interacting protein 5a n=1 Tax=Cololabis saira TaxID=129043 RepID=UPI002AD5AF0A|nr:ADP-ribosylation factor-like 6 interacting protein 5a [Cololabis saira]